MSVALCKCGYSRGESENPWYTIAGWDEDDGISSRLQNLVTRWEREEIGFRFIEYFDTRTQAKNYAAKNGMQLRSNEA